MLTTQWQTSGKSQSGGNCVEARLDDDGQIEVRDTKNPDGPTLRFTREEWVAFVGGAKDGDFDV